ncbi:hypothetical protein B0T19DRAFT_418886 [Cercophora scortea]|uniref:Uncharacterized protein n=1 Tax=Cercophora scortea TaxID=314031 RepID=A0AAE0IZC6_9PEZI|nr:hypothetical protein B0T19DRAFT_418886 [Cercophora scortea]
MRCQGPWTRRFPSCPCLHVHRVSSLAVSSISMELSTASCSLTIPTYCMYLLDLRCWSGFSSSPAREGRPAVRTPKRSNPETHEALNGVGSRPGSIDSDSQQLTVAAWDVDLCRCQVPRLTTPLIIPRIPGTCRYHALPSIDLTTTGSRSCSYHIIQPKLTLAQHNRIAWCSVLDWSPGCCPGQTPLEA